MDGERATGIEGRRFCTIREAGEYLGVKETYVKERMRSGELEGVHLGAGTRIVVASLLGYAARIERDHAIGER